MAKTRDENPELGPSAPTRRERLERIAAAERDRRAERVEMAVAAIGEAAEWPARAVLALARLPKSEGAQARQLLEEGLDIWAREIGLGPLEAAQGEDPEIASERVPQDPSLDFEPDSLADPMDRPLDIAELDHAFEQAKAEVDAMHDANRIAERVLMEEPIGGTEFAGNDLAPVGGAITADAVTSNVEIGVDEVDLEPMDEARPAASRETLTVGAASNRVLAVLDRWRQNLERRIAGRAQ